MRAVMLQPPPGFLEERRRLGLDDRDEVWDGELHIVPPPLPFHQELGSELLVVLRSAAHARGLIVTYETGLYASDNNFRVPDLMVYETRHRTHRGVEGPAVLAIEILSPDDESRAKLPFYAKVEVGEV
jgi:Uma2 family endonuclease